MKVFISYASVDAKRASTLHSLFKQRGLDVSLNTDIQVGESWDGAIQKAISKCDIFIFLLSEHFGKGRETLDEWSLICQRHWSDPSVRLIPIRLDAVDPPSFLSGVQYLDALDQQGLARCVPEIERISQSPRILSEEADTDKSLGEELARFRSLLDAVLDTRSRQILSSEREEPV